MTDLDFTREFPVWVTSDDETMAEMYRADGSTYEGGPVELWTEEQKELYSEQIEREIARRQAPD